MLTNYSELQTIIGEYLEQDDVINQIPTFIRLAESRFERELSVHWMDAIQEGFIETQTVDLPMGYLETVALFVSSTSPATRVQYYPKHLFFSMTRSSLSGTPRIYTVIGTKMYFAPDPTGVEPETYPYTLHFRQQIPKLTNNNTSNWLLDIAPDVYLYGSILEAQPFLSDDERLTVWTSMYERGKDSLVGLDSRAQFRPQTEMRRRAGYHDGSHTVRW